MQFARGRVLHAGACSDDEIDCGQLMLSETKRILDDAPHAIAGDGVAGGPDRHREAKTRSTEVIRPESHAEETVRNTLPPALDS